MGIIFNSLISLAPYFVSVIALLVFLEQFIYLKKKGSIPGPALVLPFIGNAVSLIRDPTNFWVLQSSFAKSADYGFSVNFVMGRFIVFIRNTDLSHKIFSNVRPDAFQVIMHPFGKKLFGEHNLVYLFGQDHRDLRRRIAPNFAVKPLATYTALQQKIILKHLMTWASMSSQADKPIKLRLLVRDMNLESSQAAFVGPYLDQRAREKFNADYSFFNFGFMKLPIDLPGFAFRNAVLAMTRLVDSLAVFVERSKEKMVAGEEPSCLIDFWMQDTVREVAELTESGKPVPALPSNAEIGGHVFNFLFAAQDASTSSLLWAVTLLESHPDILARVREEIAGIWPPESDTPITSHQLRQMKYTDAVAREVVRFRPPATLVPHMAGEDFPFTEYYTIPKGSIVFPSVFESSFQGFHEPDRFDPDRFFMEDRQEDQVYKRNYLVFGAGTHQCVDQKYATNHLVLFIAMFTSLIDFKRKRTDGCDDIVYVPTISPKDDCNVYLSKRSTRYPTLS